MRASNKKFSANRYLQQSKQLSRIFDLMRHSLGELGDPGFRRFMERARLPEITAHQKGIETIEQFSKGVCPEDVFGFDIIADIRRKHRKKLSEELPVTRTLKWAEYKGHALLGLNSSELIIRVALFESFLKEIHRRSLLAKPQLLSLCKPNRPVPLKDIFRSGFERFKLAEIDRQVRETDRLTVKEKAKFFRERLKLPWQDNFEEERNIVKRIEQLIDLRHNLVHSDHGIHVKYGNIEDARELLLKVPATCVNAAADKIYPDHFTRI